MVFTKEDGILIKVLRQSKGYNDRKLLEEFPDKDWSWNTLYIYIIRNLNKFSMKTQKSQQLIYVYSTVTILNSVACLLAQELQQKAYKITISHFSSEDKSK